MKTIDLWIQRFEKALDWLSKFFNRIKGLGFIVAVVLFIIFFVNNGCQKKHAVILTEKITGLSIKNDLLLNENKELDKKLQEEKDWRIVYETKAKTFEVEKNRLAQENFKLKGKLADISNSLLGISTDSSYSFLQTSAYPFQGDLNYPFNEPQVRAIHKNYLENAVLNSLVDTFTRQVDNCNDLLASKNDIINSYSTSMEVMGAKNKNYDSIIYNQSEKESIYVKENKRLERRKNLWRVTAGIGWLGFLIVLI